MSGRPGETISKVCVRPARSSRGSQKQREAEAGRRDEQRCYPLEKRPNIFNIITGLGGRDVSIQECIKMYNIGLKAADGRVADELVTWIGLRE